MFNKLLSCTAALFFLSAFCLSMSFAQEQSIKKKEMPKGILASFQKAYPKAKTVGFSKETDEGEVFYEIESTEGTIHRDVTYAADGSLLSVEETLPLDQLPEPVRSTISNEYPGAKVTRCEKVTKPSSTEFEVVVSSGKQNYELVLSEDGTVLKKETKKNGK